MALTVGSSTPVNVDGGNALEVIGARRENSQTEVEGQIAVDLIESSLAGGQVSPPTATAGNNVNIKV